MSSRLSFAPTLYDIWMKVAVLYAQKGWNHPTNVIDSLPHPSLPHSRLPTLGFQFHFVETGGI